jgi:hypothetical protein
MATSVNGRPINKQCLGNTNTTEVHGLDNEKTQCQIDKLISYGYAVVFNPDTVAQARSEGYDNCHFCIGGSTR